MTQTCTGRHEPCVLHTATATLIDGLDDLGHEMRYALMAIVSDAYVTVEGALAEEVTMDVARTHDVLQRVMLALYSYPDIAARIGRERVGP